MFIHSADFPALPNFNPQTWLELADQLPFLPFFYLQFAFNVFVTVFDGFRTDQIRFTVLAVAAFCFDVP